MTRCLWTKTKWIIAAYVVFLLPVFVAGAALAGEPLEVLLVYETKPNPPRYLGSGTAIDWEKPGLTLEMLRMVERYVPVKFSFKRVPWNRGLYLLETNQADGIFHASFKEERTKLGVYPMKEGKPDTSRAVLVQNYVFYKKKGSPFTWDGKAAANQKKAVGASAGYSIIDDLKKMGIPVEKAKTHEINFTKLMGDRIDAVADLENMADIYLERDRTWGDNIVKLAPPIKSKAYYLLLSQGFYQKHKDIAERIWNALATINGSEEFKALLQKYSD